jgi:hypothetical protein
VDVRDDITPEELMTVLPAYDGMVVRSRTKVRQPLIDVCPNLKVIVRGGVGLDTIDHEYAKSKGITVMNTPLASSASVAELAIGYMFALARNIYKATSTMKAEKWDKKSFEGDEIGGKVLGLIGLGNIGKETARRAMALGMTVVAYDPYASAAEGIRKVTLDELLAQADYISIHAPKTKETANMIGAEQFAKMKKGSHRQLRAVASSLKMHWRCTHQRQGFWRSNGRLRRGTLPDWKLIKLDVRSLLRIGAATKEAVPHRLRSCPEIDRLRRTQPASPFALSNVGDVGKSKCFLRGFYQIHAPRLRYVPVSAW